MPKISLSPHLKRFPCWLRRSVKIDKGLRDTESILKGLHINTVCQSARCPNIYDCFSRRKCTFLILGNCCTRSCRFCSIGGRGSLGPPDKREPFRIKEAVKRLGLSRVVITSVTRDDLGDAGAGHFADCVRILRGLDNDLDIEVLVPDFCGKRDLVEIVVSAGPDIFSHNIETVPRLYGTVRPGADYERSLDVIRYAKGLRAGMFTKSGMMVGFGETKDEVYSVMHDLRSAGCDIITIGQYLRPDHGCLEVQEFLHPSAFEQFSRWAQEAGFKKYSCSPFTRSSFIE